MKTLVFAALILATSAQAAPADDALATIAHFVTALNANDAAGAAATMAPAPSITDEFAPYHWQGPKALANWLAGDDADQKAQGVTGARVTIGKPLHLTVTGARAYAVVPMTYSYALKGKPAIENALFTAALEKGPGGWVIGSWTYALK